MQKGKILCSEEPSLIRVCHPYAGAMLIFSLYRLVMFIYRRFRGLRIVP
jgi:hypothetical protein